MKFLNSSYFLLYILLSLATCLPGKAQKQSQNSPSVAASSVQEPISGIDLRGMSICYDSAGRYILQSENVRYSVRGSTIASDGSLLLCGEASGIVLPASSLGFLVKCSDRGTIQWVRLYDTINRVNRSIQYYLKPLELKDGSILLTGRTYNAVNDNNDLLFTRVDNAGNIIWSKTYRSVYWTRGVGSSDGFTISQLQQDVVTGDVYFTASHFAKGINVSKLNILDGSFVWSKAYHLSSSTQFDLPFGISVNSNDLVVFEKFSSYYYSGTFIGAYRIDKTTGDTLSSKFFRITDSQTSYVGFLGTEEVVKMNNGHYAISGKLSNGSLGVPFTEYIHAAVVEFDENLNFVKGYRINNGILANVNGTRISVFKDGSGVFSMHPYISSYTTEVHYVQFKDGQILKQRKKRYSGDNIRTAGAPLRLQDGSDLIVKGLGDSITNVEKIELLRLRLTDPASECIGWDDNSNYITAHNLDPFTWRFDSISNNILRPTTNKTLSAASGIIDSKPGCLKVSDCDTISLIAPSDTICLSESIQITIRRNPGCNANPFIKFDTANIDLYNKINDSSYQFQFKTPGTKTIYGSMFGCTLLTDSIKITVMRSPGKVMLGADTIVCPGNSIRLKAGKDYSSFLWQDGSTDSVIVVRQPGEYSVRARDFCGNIFFDTIMVAGHPPIPFDIGPDSSICERDSLTITAPASFINYQWTPDYKISSPTSQIVKLSPQQETMYYLTAEKMPGCFVYDSIKIYVKKSPLVDLGGDVNLCFGDSVVLDAGPGFNQYLWNNGGIGQKSTAYNMGTYSVTAVSANGCKSSDNFSVKNVFENPVVNFGADTYLCVGSTRELSAGTYTKYLWNTGQTGKTITVDKTGLYWVAVTDNNNCIGRDSIVLTAKDCMAGFYIPNVFSPNHDGKNDIFKPLIFGNLLKYEFVIYNRWGQEVFRTNDIKKGWDANYSNVPHNTDTYVWVCTYQLDSGPLVQKKGTVVLVKY